MLANTSDFDLGRNEVALQLLPRRGSFLHRRRDSEKFSRRKHPDDISLFGKTLMANLDDDLIALACLA